MVELLDLALLAGGAYAVSQAGGAAAGQRPEQQNQEIVPPGLGSGGGLALGRPAFVPGSQAPGAAAGPNITFEAPELAPREDPQVVTRTVPVNPTNTGSATQDGSGSKDKSSKSKRTQSRGQVQTQESGKSDVSSKSNDSPEISNPGPEPTDAITGVGSGGQEIIDPAVHGEPVPVPDSGSSNQSSSSSTDTFDVPDDPAGATGTNEQLGIEPDLGGGNKTKSSKNKRTSDSGGNIVENTFDDEPGGGIGEAVGGFVGGLF